MDFQEIGKRIRKRRLELELTQEQLAEKVEVSSIYIGAIERSTTKCSIETLVKLSKVLNLSIDYLIFGNNVGNVDSTFSAIIEELPKDKHEIYIEMCKDIAKNLKKIK